MMENGSEKQNKKQNYYRVHSVIIDDDYNVVVVVGGDSNTIITTTRKSMSLLNSMFVRLVDLSNDEDNIDDCGGLTRHKYYYYCYFTTIILDPSKTTMKNRNSFPQQKNKIYIQNTHNIRT